MLLCMFGNVVGEDLECGVVLGMFVFVVVVFEVIGIDK